MNTHEQGTASLPPPRPGEGPITTPGTQTPVVVIGGSAGALSGLLNIVASLSPDLPAAVLVVIHLPPEQPSVLHEILGRAGPLRAQAARDGEVPRPGHLYVAPPDHHLMLGEAGLRLTRGPRENRSRPSIDVLFRSAAYHRGPGTVGVLLSGMQDDGTSGLWAVKHLGGTAVVQHPEEAEYPEMPMSAARQVEVDEILPAREIGPRITAWAAAARSEVNSLVEDADRRRIALEVGVAAEHNALEEGILDQGEISPFTCPECHGVMVQIKEGRHTRFRCHTGHAYTAASLLSEVRESVEATLWSAVRVLDEDVMLLEHLGKHYEAADQPAQAARLRAEAAEARERTRGLRTFILEARSRGG